MFFKGCCCSITLTYGDERIRGLVLILSLELITEMKNKIHQMLYKVTYCVPNNSGNSTAARSFMIAKLLRAIYTHYHNSNLIWRTVSRRVDEVIPSHHPRRVASRVIQWYGLIHETWYCTPDQVTIMIICLLYAFFLTFFLILKPVLVIDPEKLRERLP